MKNRIGFHYFSDTEHYQVKDLNLWLAEFKQMKIAWLVLQSPIKYAIPEEFIKGVINHGITPIVHFNFRVNDPVKTDDIRVILSAYARWGVKYVVFYNTPNLKRSWASGTWSQADLVDRFLDRYIPFAEMALSLGLLPVLPPLQPGGDYWDTTFLKKLLLLLQQRKMFALISGMHIAVSAQTFNKPIDWGKGGSATWHSKTPYLSQQSKDTQDHIGLQTWEWTTEIVKSITNTTPKIILFWFGAANVLEEKQLDAKLSLEQLLDMAQMDPNNNDSEMHGLVFGENVIACNLWLLNADGQANDEKSIFIGKQLKPDMQAINKVKSHQSASVSTSNSDDLPLASKVADWIFPIDHYLLLPSYEWGIPENVLERVRPIIRQYKPTVGFSIHEASQAKKITIWNENHAFSDDDIKQLIRAGCEVEEKVISGIDVLMG